MAVTSSGDPGGNGSARAAVPVLYQDPYSTECLIDPYPFHEELHEAGPVAWLERYDVWATGRHEQVFSRTAASDTEVGGTAIARDDRVMIFFGAANRDPRRWENPDRFDVTRGASGHMAFGLGIHGCVGKPVARIEGEAVLVALARRVGRIELSGEPQRHLNNTLRGFESLPVTFQSP
jgi:cytochrome P450